MRWPRSTVTWLLVYRLSAASGLEQDRGTGGLAVWGTWSPSQPEWRGLLPNPPPPKHTKIGHVRTTFPSGSFLPFPALELSVPWFVATLSQSLPPFPWGYLPSSCVSALSCVSLEPALPPAWPHSNLGISAKSLFPNKAHSQAPGGPEHIFLGDTLLSTLVINTSMYLVNRKSVSK